MDGGLYDISENKETIKVLDVGIGSGVLACAFAELLET